MPSNFPAEIDAICDAFEKSWQTGHVPDIRAFVDSAGSELRPILDVELVALDTEYRMQQAAEVRTVEQYAELLGIPVELLLNGDTLASSEWRTPNTRLSDASLALDAMTGDDSLISQVGFGLPGKDATGLPAIRGYRILSRVGKGGMGVVYKAIQEQANRVVALKTIHAPLLADDEQIQRFKREASAAARLSHEYIVPIYEVGESHGIHFFSMMYVDGMDLETRLRNEPLSCRDAASVCWRIADALAHAHNLGVIHRDVKPYNILVDHSLSPKLADFGVARLNDGDGSITSTGQILGTAAYMAPEQADTASSETLATVDIYGLGATLYRCLTGRPPFHAASVAEILRQVHADEPIRPSVLNKEVDADLETVCLRCLEKNPSRRFPTARDLADELRRYLNHEPIHSRKIGKLERLYRWTIRHKSTAASLVLGLALLIFVSAGIPWLLWQSTELEVAELQRQQSAESLRQVTESQRQSEEKRQQAELLAKANEARAANQEYYASLMKVREQRFRPDRKVGWTWDAADLLKKAAVLNADGRDATELRTLLAEVLLTPDIRQIGNVSDDADTSRIAVSPDGKLVALADQANNTIRVQVFRINPREVDGRAAIAFEPHCKWSQSTLSDFIRADLNELMGRPMDVRRERIQSISFSPDGKSLAAGTRNGNILVLNLGSGMLREQINKRFEERGVERLEFSPCGRILAQTSEPCVTRVFEIADDELRCLSRLECRDSTWLDDQSVMLAHKDLLLHCEPETDSSPVPLFEAPVNRRLWNLDAIRLRQKSWTVVCTDPPEIRDASTGDLVLQLDRVANVENQPNEVRFSSTGAAVLARVSPQNFRIWESHSGRVVVDASMPGNDLPMICPNPLHDVFFIASHKSLLAYQYRGTPMQDHSSRCAFADSKELGLSMLVVQGQQPIKRFASNEQGGRIAWLERGHLPDSNELADRFRVRCSIEEVGQTSTPRNWTCLTLGPYAQGQAIQGDQIDFGPQPDRIIFTSVIPGQIVEATPEGFRFTTGIDMDGEVVHPEKIEPRRAKWTGKPCQTHPDHSGHHVGVTLNFPRSLKQHETVNLRFRFGDSTEQLHVLSCKDVPVDGWYLLTLPGKSTLPESVTPDVIMEVNSSTLTLASEESTANGNANVIAAGPMHIIPWKRMRRGQSAVQCPLRLGPFVARSDGGLDAVIESWTLRQWNNLAAPATSAFWRDEKNSEEDIRGLVATPWGTFLGTDSGLVALIDADGYETVIQPANTKNGPFDSRDGVAAVDFAQNTNLAIAGTLRGQVKVYDLKKPGGPAFLFDAHEREITALSIDDDAKLIATAAGDGSLRIWNVLGQKASLHFEYTGRSNRISQLKLIDNGRKLLILRDGDAGIVQLDLGRFNTVFRDYQMLD